MKPTCKGLLGAVLMVAAVGTLALAQMPSAFKQIDFTINVPYSLGVGNYVLPEGSYVIRQVQAGDLYDFALYKDDMRHTPVAMLRAAPISPEMRYSGHTRVMTRIDESSQGSLPVLKGWNIPGWDGWEIVDVTPRNHSVLTRVK